MAGLGLGHTISQALGVMIFLGLNQGLSTKLSQAYGSGQILQNLRLCGHYMNQAYLKNILIFLPLSLALGNIKFFLNWIGQDPEVSEIA